MNTLVKKNVIHGDFSLGRKNPETNLEQASRSSVGMFNVITVGLIQTAHDGYQLADKLLTSNPALSAELSASCDSLVSVAVTILREPRGDVPFEIADEILFVDAAVAADEKLVSVSAKPAIRSKRRKNVP
jgi:hypothetical protein